MVVNDLIKFLKEEIAKNPSLGNKEIIINHEDRPYKIGSILIDNMDGTFPINKCSDNGAEQYIRDMYPPDEIDKQSVQEILNEEFPIKLVFITNY